MTDKKINTRKNLIYFVLIVFGLIFAGRLFFIQVVNGQYYKNLAQSEQLRKFEIPADRGAIYMKSRDGKIPLALNQNYKIIYADPRYVEDPDGTAQVLSGLLGGKTERYRELISKENSVYVVLEKSVEPDLADKVNEQKLPGIGLQDSPKRVYPEGKLAAQLLGFVNDDGQGQYGLEGYLNEELSGEPGLLKTITDARGIPLSTSDDGGIDVPVVNGSDITLTIDRSVQRAVEDVLKSGVERTRSKSGSAIVIDSKTGAVLAMANYPTYDPAKFFEEKDANIYQNLVVSDPYEPGSVMKAFTMSAGLQTGAVNINTTYNDTGSVKIDGWTINNAQKKSWGVRDVSDVMRLSINTGIINVLRQMGGGEINLQGRQKLYDTLTNNYRFGAKIDIAQSNEAPGLIIGPKEAEGNNVKYANITFGQGMTATVLQVSSSFTALVNGGDFYKPYLIHSKTDGLTGEETVNEPQIISNNALTDEVSKQLRQMLVSVVTDGGGYYAERPGFTIGGKTGTSQLTEKDGTYSLSRYVGSFVGFISSGGVNATPEYVIMTRVVEPQVGVGADGAVPIFGDIIDFLIKYYQITPSS